MRSLALVTWLVLVSGCSNAPDTAPQASDKEGAAASATVASAGDYRGTWYWIGMAVGGQAQWVADPSRYRIEFAEPGTVLVKADCNQGRAAYTLSAEAAFALGPVGLTKMGCPDDSQDREFLAQFAQGRALAAAKHWLRVDLADNLGTMLFAREPQATLKSYVCATGTPFVVARAGTEARLLIDDTSFDLQAIPAATGMRFSDGQVSLRIDAGLVEVSGAPTARQGCKAELP